MTKNTSLSVSSASVFSSHSSLSDCAPRSFSLLRPTAWLQETRAAAAFASVCTYLLEVNVTPRQAAQLIWVILSLFVCLLPCPLDAGWRVCALLIACRAIKKSAILKLLSREG
ncbi:MAG: hypothetical protein ACI3YC_00420 [Alloprevotella sp.]